MDEKKQRIFKLNIFRFVFFPLLFLLTLNMEILNHRSNILDIDLMTENI